MIMNLEIAIVYNYINANKIKKCLLIKTKLCQLYKRFKHLSA